MPEHPDPIAIANLTGYPLQFALEAVVRQRERECHWYVLSREHFCSSPTAPQALFIDLLLSGQRQDPWSAEYFRCLLVIECKRIDGDWVFLEPREAQPGGNRDFHLLTTTPSRDSLQQPTHPWCPVQFGPTNVQSAFCALSTRRGSQSGQPDRRTLEGWCAELLTATVGLSQQTASSFIPSIAFDARDTPIRRAVFVPIIVTTARLTLLSFDPAAAPLSTGTLPPPPDSSAKELPWIWFAKDFGFQPGGSDPLSRVTRTSPSQGILIVQSKAFPEFLDESRGIQVRGPEV